jgi:hypothetical protein
MPNFTVLPPGAIVGLKCPPPAESPVRTVAEIGGADLFLLRPLLLLNEKEGSLQKIPGRTL